MINDMLTHNLTGKNSNKSETVLTASGRLRHGSSVKSLIKSKKILKNQKLDILAPDSQDSATTIFLITIPSHVT